MGQPAFEVASVKPSPPLSAKSRGLFVYPGGRMVAWSYTLKQLIRSAYNLDPNSLDIPVLGGPSWADEDPFDVEAKPPESSQSSHWVPAKSTAPPTPEMRLMLQTLLADRFQLKLHTEPKKENVYALVLAKGGPKLKPSDGARSPSLAASKTGPMDRMVNLLTGQNVSMAMLAAALAQTLRRPVLDQTGLTGNFDFHVVYPPDDGSGSAPPLVRALERQLGLRLETKRENIDVLVIDHAEKPAGN
jgi:uncharacterized protein (TIGR03435 family)